MTRAEVLAKVLPVSYLVSAQTTWAAILTLITDISSDVEEQDGANHFRIEVMTAELWLNF